MSDVIFAGKEVSVLRSSQGLSGETGIPEVLVLQTGEKPEAAEAGDPGHCRIPSKPDRPPHLARSRDPVQGSEEHL